MIRLLKSRSII